MSNLNSDLTLLGVMRKQGFQLADAVSLFLKGEIEISTDSLYQVVVGIPEKQQVQNNIIFLNNLVNNEELFRGLAQKALKPDGDKTAEEKELASVNSAIKTFKQLDKISGMVSLEEYARFIGEELPVEPSL